MPTSKELCRNQSGDSDGLLHKFGVRCRVTLHQTKTFRVHRKTYFENHRRNNDHDDKERRTAEHSNKVSPMRTRVHSKKASPVRKAEHSNRIIPMRTAKHSKINQGQSRKDIAEINFFTVK